MKLLSMNHFDMEENSRPECLVDFKRAYGASIEAVRGCLVKFFPDMAAKTQQNFLYAFMPFLYDNLPLYHGVREAAPGLVGLRAGFRVHERL